MGVPLRTNIFQAGSDAQRYFVRFPVQVAILFSPSDVDFTEHLRARFVELDRSTGDRLVFFAVLDPPEEWLEDRFVSRWWNNYQRHLGFSSFTVEDRVLMREVGRLFGIPWHSFPSLVASPNLWRVEYVSCPTSPELLGVQLNALAKLSGRLGRPNVGHIVATLEGVTGKGVRHHPPNEYARRRLGEFYEILHTFDPRLGLKKEEYRHTLGRQLDVVENNLASLRSHRHRFQDIGVEETVGADQEVTDSIIEDAAGRLVAPASVAARVLHELQSSANLPDLLDEEAVVMLETAVTVGSFLEQLTEVLLKGPDPFGWWRPLRFHGKRELPSSDLDFTPGAQGVWKAFELEVNLSVVQAARAARDVAMPKYFALFDSALPYERGLVETGRRGNQSIYVDINQLDWTDRASGRHRFIALGEALHLVREMIGSPAEKLDTVIRRTTGVELPPRVLEKWRMIVRIRNKGSHVHRLGRQDYEMVLQAALAPETIGPLLKIKEGILRGMP